MLNVDQEVRDGIRSLQQRSKAGEIVCFPTDKSGKLSVDSVSNYIESMATHHEDMAASSLSEYQNIETNLNAHITAWGNVFNINKRAKNSFVATNNIVAPLYGLRKDHKRFDDATKGPPLRPVCGAVVNNNMRISYFLSSILRPIIALSDDVCDNTDDMLSRVAKCNEADLSKCIVGSMDVEALYPSIDIEFAVEKCAELLMDSGIEFKNVDTDELGMFLVFNDTEENLHKADLLRYCPNRTSNMGRKPVFTASGVHSSRVIRWKNWKKSEEKPPNLRKMVVHALAITLRYTLSNHVCQFNDHLFKQLKGGAIGVGIAGDVAILMMVWWDKQLKSKCPNVQMYARYVDDIDVVVETDDDDETAMKRIQTVANEIHPSIRVTIDYPSKHPDGKLPVLDTKQWIEGGNLLHTYYSKPMSNKYVVMASSALPPRSKQNILIADLLRIMRCVSPLCDQNERNQHVQDFIDRMQISGYSQEDRVSVYKSARAKYNRQLKNDADGNTPLYRSKQLRKQQRLQEKPTKKTWYGDKYEAVYFVEATPGSQLADECQRIFKRCDLKVKVVERTGKTLKQLLVKSDPLRKTECQCCICTVAGKQICKVRECVYQMSCSICHQEYVGETSRSLAERYREHMTLFGRKDNNSVMFKHAQSQHKEEIEQVTWKVKILARCPGDPSLRQATEATYIYNKRPMLNRKSEHTDHGRRSWMRTN